MMSAIKTVALAWMIILGGIMITPDGIFCIACYPVLFKVLGVISILLGAVALVISRQGLTTSSS